MTKQRENLISGHSLSESHSSESQFLARKKLAEIFQKTPLPNDELMMSLGMYMRGSVIVKILALEEFYKRILNIPGCIMEFGTRWGQNLILFENFRAIFEPFNKTRKIIGFDTFKGYEGHSSIDRAGEIFNENTYQTTPNYPTYLRDLIAIHEANNVLGHVSNNHKIIEGNVSDTVIDYMSKNRESIVALAYFDMGLYEPTKVALETIKPHLVSGSVLLLDELTWSESPGEAIAFKEVFKRDEYKIEKSSLTPMRSIITIK